MRFALVAAIWLILVGGLAFYTHEKDRRQPPPVADPVTQPASADSYALEITPTFTTATDPFALQGDPAASATLLARVGGSELLRVNTPVPAGTPVTVSPVPGLVVGLNELYVRGVPPADEPLDHAVRVRLLQGGRVVLDETLWGAKGANVTGSIPFTLAEDREGGHGG